MNENLIRFVNDAREKGLDYATIRLVLLSAGWKAMDVAEVFCTHDLGLSIPKPIVDRSVGVRVRPASAWPRGAWVAGYHLLTFGALYTWATSLILLFFAYINIAFPDPAWRISQSALEESLSSIRAELAVLIVSFPIFLILWHFSLRDARQNPKNAKNAIHLGLGYLSIFVGALLLSGDVMTLIYFLLEGELTVRLLLKAAGLFLIAGSLVLYLAHTLRSEPRTEEEQ